MRFGSHKTLPSHLKCPICENKMQYHQWPCVDEASGDHLGDYQVYHCPHCDVHVDASNWRFPRKKAPTIKIDFSDVTRNDLIRKLRREGYGRYDDPGYEDSWWDLIDPPY